MHEDWLRAEHVFLPEWGDWETAASILPRNACAAAVLAHRERVQQSESL